jgi:hypothetical protein
MAYVKLHNDMLNTKPCRIWPPGDRLGICPSIGVEIAYILLPEDIFALGRYLLAYTQKREHDAWVPLSIISLFALVVTWIPWEYLEASRKTRICGPQGFGPGGLFETNISCRRGENVSVDLIAYFIGKV